jgi:hypothetical protein
MSSSPTKSLTGRTGALHRLRQGGALTAVFVAVSFCAAACGGGSGTDPSASRGSNSADKAVAYADCMRAHGVTNYPDPGSSGISNAGTGIDFGSATFQSARAKCSKLSPMPPIDTHATEQQIRQAVESATCMRDHGFPSFPDPIVTSTPPAPPPGPPSTGSGTPGTTEYGDGILFKVPISIDVSSAAFQAAAKACNSPLYVPGGAPPVDGAPS